MKLRWLFLMLVVILVVQNTEAQSPIQSFKRYTGNWKVVVQMWMMSGDPPMSDSLTSKNEMMMNDLFFVSKYSGVMMAMDYEGERTIAYDVVKKKFVSTFVDNMNSGIDYKEGMMSADGKTIELRGTTVDAATEKNISTREVITFIDQSRMTIDEFESIDSSERKTLEYSLTKK